MLFPRVQGGSGQDPTWRSLVAALNCIEEKELADKVEKKHCGPLEEAGMLCVLPGIFFVYLHGLQA